MKKLIIAEKPSVARDIAAAIGGFKKVDTWLENDHAVISSGIGHLVEIFTPSAEKRSSLADLPIIPDKFDLRAIDKTKTQFTLLKKLIARKDVTAIVNACDAGREGELIFRLIYELAGTTKPVKRMWLQSMTPAAINEAYRNMKDGRVYDSLAAAARCRAEADWLIGINGSRALSALENASVSVGRVQTPTLGILVDLERRIRDFVVEDYFEVKATFQTRAGIYDGKWTGSDKSTSFSSKSDALAIVSKCSGQPVSKVSEVFKESESSPPKLFDLTTLQREANRLFKFSAKKTLEIAQALYERHKATTYPRTDSSALPEDYLETANRVISTLCSWPSFSKYDGLLEVKLVKRIFNNEKIRDHFAVIPTGKLPENLSDDEQKVFDLICKRFLAAFAANALYLSMRRETNIGTELFVSTGRVLKTPGWTMLYDQEVDAEPALATLEPSESPTVKDVRKADCKTKAPTRLTEAGLLAAMESAGKLVDDDEAREAMKECGLGTPATRASIIESLLSTGVTFKREPYVRRDDKTHVLVPTAKGEQLITLLEKNGLQLLTSAAMTGEWEKKLRSIESGQSSAIVFKSGISDFTTQIIGKVKGLRQIPSESVTAVLKHSCPCCAGALQKTVDQRIQCGNCTFVIEPKICGYELTEQDVQALLSSGKTGLIDCFISGKTQRKFSAFLVLNKEKGRIGFEFDTTKNVDSEKTTVAQSQNKHQSDVAYKCPECAKSMQRSGKRIFCACGDFTLWFEVAGKLLSEKDINDLLQHGRTGKLQGFTRKAQTGQKPAKFEAAVELLKGGKVKFNFSR